VSRKDHVAKERPGLPRTSWLLSVITANGEGSMALNNCFNSATCASMTEHWEEAVAPEGLSLVPEGLVVGLG
jgi:hypothetical protein